MSESLVDEGLMKVVTGGMAGSFAGAAESRTRRFDQLAEDSASMWSVALTSPTVNAGLGYRAATESGSGRTRSETNNPGNTAAPGGA